MKIPEFYRRARKARRGIRKLKQRYKLSKNSVGSALSAVIKEN